MADSITKLILIGEDQGASQLIDQIGGGIGSAGSMLGALANPATIATGVLVGVGAAAAGVGAHALSMSEDMSQAMLGFAADTGTAVDELEPFQEIAENIFTSNWGDDLSDVATSMAEVATITGEAGQALEDMTTNALILRDTLGVEVPEGTDAAKVLMDEFGLSSQQAFDFITYGMQNGLNRSGDFVDSIREYSNLFSEAGFTAEEFYSVMETGAGGGVLGTDKIADSFKEAGISIMEVSDDMFDALDLIGMNTDGLLEKLEDGSVTVADVMNEAIPLLADMENEVWQNTAGVALFGTAFEDLGASAFETLSTTSTGLAEMEGATQAAGDAVSGGLGNAWESFRRGIDVALLPLGDVLAGVLTNATPFLESFGEWFGVALPAAMEFTGNIFGEYWPIISEEIGAAWEIIQPIVDPLLEWLAEKAPVALEFLYDYWVNVAWPAFAQSVVDSWNIFKVQLEATVEFLTVTLPNGLETFKTAGQTAFDNFTGKVEDAFNTVERIFTGVRDFGEWLAGNVFAIKFDIPSLPDWMTTQSPMKLHTAFVEFNDYLQTNPISPKVDSRAERMLGFATGGNNAAPATVSTSRVVQIGTINVSDPTTGRLLLDWLDAQETAATAAI